MNNHMSLLEAIKEPVSSVADTLDRYYELRFGDAEYEIPSKIEGNVITDAILCELRGTMGMAIQLVWLLEDYVKKGETPSVKAFMDMVKDRWYCKQVGCNCHLEGLRI